MPHDYLDEIHNPATTIERLRRIMDLTAGQAVREEENQKAMEAIMRRPSSRERDSGLAHIINTTVSQPSLLEAAAKELLKSSTATNQELARIVLQSEKYREEAAKRMVQNGELTDTHRRWLQEWTPELMGVEDTSESKRERSAFNALTGRK